MSSKSMEAIQQELQNKIRDLVLEFGAGKISNEQFNIIYQRYHSQMQMVMGVIGGTDDRLASNDISTIAIRSATTGKATGMGIYHHHSGTMVETLGNFDLSPAVMSPVLNDFSDQLESGYHPQPITKKLDDGKWVIFMSKQYTTAVVQFRNEPAPRQVREMERLLSDFEAANEKMLRKMSVDSSKLAKPFIGFVQKKLK
jgi:hypothetical protein